MSNWDAGTQIVFSGRTQISWGIRLVTMSRYSHTAIIASIDREDLVRARKRNKAICEKIVSRWPTDPVPLLFESTLAVSEPCELSGYQIHGVQAHPPWTRLRGYNGRAWRLPLADRWRLTSYERRHLARLLLSRVGLSYDAAGAVLAGTIFSKRWWATRRAADRSTLYCTEYVADSLVRTLRHRDEFPTGATPGRWAPLDLVRWGNRTGIYNGLFPLPTATEEVD